MIPKPLTGTKTFTTGFDGRVVRSGQYRCEHTNVNLGSERFVPQVSLTITRHGVYCKHGRNGKALLDTQRVAFFNPRETYRSSHPFGCGDHGDFLDVRGDVVRDVVATIEPRLADRNDGPFPWDDGPLAPIDALELERLVARQARPERSDALELEERWLALFARFVTAAVDARAAGNPKQRVHGPVPRSVVDVITHARGLVAAHYAEPLSLSAIAAQVGISPFHLSRSFSAVVGVPLHRFREGCRLRVAIECLRRGEVDLTGLALRLGFSSHSHFTDRFRRAFGVTPSAFRATI